MTIEELAEKLGLTLTDENRAQITASVNAYTAAQTTGLKQNNKDLLADRNALKAKLKVFEGIDTTEFTELLTELEAEPGDVIDRLRNAPKAAGDAVKQAEAAAEAKFQRQVTKANKERDDARAALDLSNKARIDGDIERFLSDEIAKKKGNAAILLANMRGRVKGEIGEDGKVKITVLAANGDELLSDAGTPGTVADLVESYRRNETFGIAFEADGGGSGAGGGGTKKPGNVGKNPFKKATWNLTEQSRLRASNPTLADQLKREAANA